MRGVMIFDWAGAIVMVVNFQICQGSENIFENVWHKLYSSGD